MLRMLDIFGRRPPRQRRRGFSYLELQVAFALLAIALSGLGPLVVMQSRQIAALESRFEPETDYHIVPSRSEWAQKLGAIADVTTEVPGADAQPVYLIDNTHPGFSLVDIGSLDWVQLSYADAHLGTQYRNNSGGTGDAALWTFTDLKPGSYEVFVTYSAQPNHATNSPFDLFDGTSWIGRVSVNQKIPPSGPTIDGTTWRSLGLFATGSGTLVVRLIDQANGHIAADAVRINPVRNVVQVVNATKSLSSETVTAQVLVTEVLP